MKKKEISDLGRCSVDTYRQLPKLPLIVVLDNVRSQHNVGAVFRTSDAFLIEKIYLCGITATPPHREIQKAALGATESVAWEYREKTIDALHELRQRGYRLLALEQAVEACSLENFSWDGHQGLAVVLGNEVEGVDQAVMALVDQAIEIPQWGTKHSLNVSVSAGILLWELVRIQIKNNL